MLSLVPLIFRYNKGGVLTQFSFFSSLLTFLSRERPKFQIKDNGETSGNGTQTFEEGSNTVKVTREPRVDETVRARWIARM